MDEYVIRIEGPLPDDALEGFTELTVTPLEESHSRVAILDEPPRGLFG
jgi:hypothetical protein